MQKKTLNEYTLFAEAWAFLAFARFALLFLPFKRIVPLLGKSMVEASGEAENKTELLDAIALAVNRACKYSPWRTKCFEQAIAAKIILKQRRLKSTLYLGVYKDQSDKMQAHAWLKHNTVIVTGGPSIEKYTVINWFGS